MILKLLQTIPALLASAVILLLAVGLFAPPEFLPAWFRESRLKPIPAVKPPEVATTIDAVAEESSEVTDANQPAPPAAPARIKTSSLDLTPSAPKSVPLTTVSRTRPESPAELMNCRFTPLPAHPTQPPRVVDLPVPRFPGRHAVWGGTGRDLQGRIWIGACAEGNAQPSARLFGYDPQTGELIDAGDVVSALRDHGLLRDGEGQMKIHSKIIQAGDGHLYFASMDEQGENPDGSKLPTWGGHLWRLRLPERKWEHLHAAPEALIAVAGMGRYVYALGYFNHVLIQFDTETGMIATHVVGSVDGHVSRNLLADLHGHVYVPRLERDAATNGVRAELVEFDPSLTEVGRTELAHYHADNPTASHGITGVQPLEDGSLAFVTHRGRLYRVQPAESGPAEVNDLGWMHPLGATEIESLFTCDGKSWVMAAARLPAHDYEWVAFDLKSSSSRAGSLEFPLRYAGVNKAGLLLYGSMTRDDEGAYYLAGVSMNSEPYGPVVWRVLPP